MKYAYLYSIALFMLFHFSYAQQTISGVIEDYPGEAAEVILPVQEPRIIGTVTENGEVTIQLEDQMASEVTDAQEKANAESENIRIVNKTVGEAFYCGSDDVVTINGDEVLESLTMQGMFFVGIMEEQKPVGQLRLASSKEFGDSYFSMGKKDFMPGYYIDFYYVNEDASVKGVCKTQTYTLDMKETFYYTHNYDIDLKKGWNIVKIGVTEVYKDQNGRMMPLTYEMRTLEKLPEDVQFTLDPIE